MSGQTKQLSHLEIGLSRQTLRHASAGRRALLLLTPLLVALVVLQGFISDLFAQSLRQPIAWASALAVGILGVIAAQALGKALLPPLAQRVGSETAGQVDFLIRIVVLVIVVLIALSVAGVSLSGIFASAGLLTLLVGFASQQTLQQIVAGFVLLSTRRVKIGDRVKIHYPAIEGRVTRIGLMYSLFEQRPSAVWNVPNSTLLQATVTSVKTASPVTIKAAVPDQEAVWRLRSRLKDVSVRTQTEPDVEIERLEPSEIELVVSATPASSQDRAKLEAELTSLLQT